MAHRYEYRLCLTLAELNEATSGGDWEFVSIVAHHGHHVYLVRRTLHPPP